MKAADIPNGTFLAAVSEAIRRANTGNRYQMSAAMASDVWEVLREQWPDLPYKVMVAKARKLIGRGLLDGCPCGCRGDWEPVCA